MGFLDDKILAAQQNAEFALDSGRFIVTFADQSVRYYFGGDAIQDIGKGMSYTWDAAGTAAAWAYKDVIIPMDDFARTEGALLAGPKFILYGVGFYGEGALWALQNPQESATNTVRATVMTTQGLGNGLVAAGTGLGDLSVLATNHIIVPTANFVLLNPRGKEFKTGWETGFRDQYINTFTFMQPDDENRPWERYFLFGGQAVGEAGGFILIAAGTGGAGGAALGGITAARTGTALLPATRAGALTGMYNGYAWAMPYKPGTPKQPELILQLTPESALSATGDDLSRTSTYVGDTLTYRDTVTIGGDLLDTYTLPSTPYFNNVNGIVNIPPGTLVLSPIATSMEGGGAGLSFGTSVLDHLMRIERGLLQQIQLAENTFEPTFSTDATIMTESLVYIPDPQKIISLIDTALPAVENTASFYDSLSGEERLNRTNAMLKVYLDARAAKPLLTQQAEYKKMDRLMRMIEGMIPELQELRAAETPTAETPTAPKSGPVAPFTPAGAPAVQDDFKAAGAPGTEKAPEPKTAPEPAPDTPPPAAGIAATMV